MFERIYYYILDTITVMARTTGLNPEDEMWKQVTINNVKNLIAIYLIPFILIAVIAIGALIFAVLSYRNTRKILKRLNEKERPNE